MAFRWRADDDPTWNASLVALRFFRGLGPVMLENFFFIFQGVRTPAPRSGSGHAVLGLNTQPFLTFYTCIFSCFPFVYSLLTMLAIYVSGHYPCIRNYWFHNQWVLYLAHLDALKYTRKGCMNQFFKRFGHKSPPSTI